MDEKNFRILFKKLHFLKQFIKILRKRNTTKYSKGKIYMPKMFSSKMRKVNLLLTFATLLVFSAFINAQTSGTATSAKKVDPLKNFQYRQIGPYRGGRVTAVAGIPNNKNVYYFGATGGGVWKTTDAGVNWTPVSDKYFKTGSVGAIAVSESNPNVVYVGMGESAVRGNVSHGDGVYKSIDGGKTWKHVGLKDTQQIGRVRIHPKNPDIVYVAAIGHLWGANEERGVFRTMDGGKTWKKILYKSKDAGAFDLIFDPSNPNVIYTTFWQVRRTPYSLSSGGSGSGIYKSFDGGDTWQEISGNKGLPKGVMGKIGITVSPVNTNRVWAMIESKQGGLYRSEDAGETWRRVSNNPQTMQRPWYYYRVYADTQDVNTVYVLNVRFHKSIDGGRTFNSIRVPHSDNHDLWIDPNDNKRMIEGNDGGANVSFDGGKTWTEQDQPTAQFYRLHIDNDFPYNIYGAQQDNSTVKIPSRTASFGINESHWHSVGGGESGWIAPHPENSDIVFAGSYGGFLTHYNHRTKQRRIINVYPDNPMGAGVEAMKYRFNWNFPIIFSNYKTNGKYPLYAAGHILFRSMDEGQSWQPISPDLTRNEKSKQGTSGGPITQDNTSVEYYNTIFALAESTLQKGVIWAGSDDGLVHITRDGGKNWSNVTPRGLPRDIQINSIDASRIDAGTAYVAATAYKSDDFKPYLYKTNDYGKTWKKIVNGIPDDAFTRVVREDPNRRGFLYAGTETGMYYSSNDGETWQSLQLNLPVVPITDLAVHKGMKDLVVATQGRSFWILDDLTLLYQMPNAQNSNAFLFKPEDAYRTPGFGRRLPPTVTIGENPPNGAVVHYYLKSKPAKEISLEFLDSNGKVLRKFAGKMKKDGTPAPTRPGQPAPPMEIGLNEFVWNFRLPNATGIPRMILWGGSLAGPKVAPGNYSVRMTVDGKAISTESFAIKPDPRVPTTQAQYKEQFDFLLKARDKLTETHKAILEIRSMRNQLRTISSKLKPEHKDLKTKASDIIKKITNVEETLMQTKIKSSQDALNYPIKLNNKLAALASTVGAADYPPTAQSYDVYNDLVGKIDAQLAIFRKVKVEDVKEFNEMYNRKKLPIITAGR